MSERETGTEIEKDPSCPAYQTSGSWIHVSHVTRHRLHITHCPRDLKVEQVNALVMNIQGSISFKGIVRSEMVLLLVKANVLLVDFLLKKLSS